MTRAEKVCVQTRRSAFVPLLTLAIALSPFVCESQNEISIVNYSQSDTQARTEKLSSERAKKDQDALNSLSAFRALPPQQRVEIWKRSNNYKYRNDLSYRVSREIQDLSVIEGTDTVPYLAQILRDKHEPYFYRFWAMTILGQMDRYVPEQNFPKGVSYTISVETLNLHGTINWYQPIDGRRIGSDGLTALQWAANNADDSWLKFFARKDLGLLKKELSALPLEEQIRRYRASITKWVLIAGGPTDQLATTLQDLIVEEAPDSIPPILETLKRDNNKTVQKRFAGLLVLIDAYRVRLRKSQLGRSAIEAVHQAYVRRKIKPDCAACQKSAKTWTRLAAQFYDDRVSISASYAHYLNAIYGEKTVNINYVGTIRQEAPVLEITPFMTYLTDKDPYFPSWEFVDPESENSQPFHPGFQEKMARIEEAWREFQSTRSVDPKAGESSSVFGGQRHLLVRFAPFSACGPRASADCTGPIYVDNSRPTPSRFSEQQRRFPKWNRTAFIRKTPRTDTLNLNIYLDSILRI
jgi:hypothetical protein